VRLLRLLFAIFALLMLSASALAQASAIFAKAYDLLRSGDIETSIAMFKRGLEIEPNNAPAHYYLGQALLKQSPPNEEEALQHFTQSSRLGPNTTEGADALAQSIGLRRKMQDQASLPGRQATGEAPPTMFAGDRWVYRRADGRRTTYTVTNGGNAWSVNVVEESVMKNGERSVESDRELRVQGWNKADRHYDPHDGATPFPLSVGRTVNFNYVYTMGSRGPVQQTRSFRVVRWEKVKVTAGEFLALRLEDDHGGYTWYSPAAKAFLTVGTFVGTLLNPNDTGWYLSQHGELVEYTITRDGGWGSMDRLR
jgi:hypothetical protein